MPTPLPPQQWQKLQHVFEHMQKMSFYLSHQPIAEGRWPAMLEYARRVLSILASREISDPQFHLPELPIAACLRLLARLNRQYANAGSIAGYSPDNRQLLLGWLAERAQWQHILQARAPSTESLMQMSSLPPKNNPALVFRRDHGTLSYVTLKIPSDKVDMVLKQIEDDGLSRPGRTIDQLRATATNHHAHLEQANIERLWVYGSIAEARGNFFSDIDMLVELRHAAPVDFTGWDRLAALLEGVFQHPVDVTAYSAAPERFRHAAQLIFPSN